MKTSKKRQKAKSVISYEREQGQSPYTIFLTISLLITLTKQFCGSIPVLDRAVVFSREPARFRNGKFDLESKKKNIKNTKNIKITPI